MAVVWLASYPRSGNTFFRMVCWKYFGIPTYSMYEEGEIWNSGIGAEVGAKKLDPHYMESKDTFLVKTHSRPIDASPAIYLIRDGRDALLSYSEYLTTRDRSWLGKDPTSIMKHLINKGDGWGGWGGNVSAWLDWEHTKAVVRFDELIADPINVVARALEAVGGMQYNWVDGSNHVMDFEELHERWGTFFVHGTVGRWKEDMPPSVIHMFDKVWGHVLAKAGY